jgi:DNA polymerase elongation subunit (family B)
MSKEKNGYAETIIEIYNNKSPTKPKSPAKPKTPANTIKPNTIKPNMIKPNDKLEFQICDWNSYHEIDGDDVENYVIQLFGRTEDDKDVCIKVTGFTPFFYVEIPLAWTKKQADKFVEILKNKVSWCTENNPNYEYDLTQSLYRHALVQKHKFYNFSNKKYFKFIMLVFKSHTAMREYANILAKPLKAPELTKEPMLYQRYECNIEPHIRFMHINNLSSCGWVSIDQSKLKENKNYSDCDHSYKVNWKEVKPSDNDDRIAPFKIMAYDIECISCDHNFPQAERKTDKIIQIGMTMYRYGSMICYEQHILTLGECSAIKGANVECYKTEKGLIRGWAKKIKDLRPDFKAGYNNFGFDDRYIYDRIARIDEEAASKKGISVEELENKFMDEVLRIMGKINNDYLMEVEGLKKSLTYFEIKNLSSSALGDNELKFYQVPGILSVDMMKIIQRDHRLIGYKLDNVSANFITEGATKFVEEGQVENGRIKINIYTKSTKALEKDSYIQIMVNDGYSSTPLSEGAKYKVLDIDTITEKKFNEKENKEETFVYQCIKTEIGGKDVVDLREIILNPLLKIFWTFAKDDMHHTLINKYFREGDPKKIRQIAKYCLKDCKLVNLLLAKLEIIVNSVGMAKVCHVPLSYLFLRGQGVKIFSLVSKKCREKNFLIPVLRRKKKDASGDEDETYEGATVINPKPDVYLSPIGVLDYSSLYPNSMRERNLSQECYVNDTKYDNLPGYIYHDVYITLKDKKGKIIKNIDGTPQKEHHRFAQELITDEQINDELADIFDKINSTTESNINKISKQKTFTEDNRKELSKLLIKHLVEMDDAIKNTKDEHEKIIKKITDDSDLSDADKKEQISTIKEKMAVAIKEIEESVEPTAEEKEILINNEKEKAKKKITDEKAKRYNVVNGQTVRYGILPEILTELLNKRKDTNARLAQEKDSFKKAILNALQLAFKVTANSLYGQTGAPTSPIYFIAIAASTTAIGRERLHYAKKIVEESFPGSEVIYGDSVSGDTPLICRESNGDINITTIEELNEGWEPYDQFKAGDSNRSHKQQSVVNCDVWTSNGWANVKRVIRHKTNKKIFRVLTHTGCIDVTEDHSLLDKNKNIIKPTDCKIGTELLHGFMEPNNIYNNISKEEAFVWGFFMSSGHCKMHTTNHGKKYAWVLNCLLPGILDTCKNYLEQVENIKFDIHDMIDPSYYPYKLVPVGNNKHMFDKYRSIFYGNKKNKSVPKEILNSTKDIKESFFRGYCTGYEGLTGREIGFLGNINIKGKVNAQCFYYLLKCLEKDVRIHTNPNKKDVYGLCIYYGLKRNINATKEIDFLGLSTNDENGEFGAYVYDLETDDGTFHAGIGEMIVKNTDSIFINFHLKDADGNEQTDKHALMETIELCQKAAKLINDNVPKPQSIVYEKTLHPFILVAKKKYVGLLFEKDPNKYFLKSMGIVLKRRDNAPIVKIVVGGIIDYLLKNRDIDRAVEYTKEVLRKLMDGAYPIDKFIISKTLRANYKQTKNIKTGKLTSLPAHKILADRMAARDPGNKPQINDRIPFVYIVKDMGKKKKKDILQGDLIEHPDYVIKQGLKIDYLYYLEHQIINPATQILELLMPTKKVGQMFGEFIIEEENIRKKRQSMEKWMDYSTTKATGSKTAKEPYISLKKLPKKDDKYNNIPYIGKTRKIECQNMEKWMDFSKIKKSQSLNPKRQQAMLNENNQSSTTSNKSSNKSSKISISRCQNMDKWMDDSSKTVDGSDWELEFG